MAEDKPPPSSSDASEDARRRRADDKQASQQMWKMAGLGAEFAASVGGMALIGWVLDRQFGTSPTLVLVLMSLGFVGGLWNLIKAARREFRR